MMIMLCEKCGEGYRPGREHICHEKNFFPHFNENMIKKFLKEKERNENEN